MLFGHTYKIKFKLNDGRKGKCTIEARFANKQDIIAYAKRYISFEIDVPVEQITILDWL